MDATLTINGGSSSIKFAVYEAGPPQAPLLAGEIQRVGQPGTSISATGLGNEVSNQPIEATDHTAAANHLIGWLQKRMGSLTLSGIGHRVVHGGLHLVDHQVITADVLRKLHAATDLDSSHLPREIALIESFAKQFPNVPQIACFDSGFFKNLPITSRLLPIPRKYLEQGIHRFGFHGISYSYLMKTLGRLGGESATNGRVILAHLGSGASMAAVKRGEPIDTTMSFTPIAGLMMGTRPGDLDPGLLAYLIRNEKLTTDQIDDLLNKQSGLLGVSGKSSDMRDLVARRASDPHAGEAVDLFCYEVKKRIGAFAAAMGGVDTLIFSGGIGQHSAEARLNICRGLEFLGISISDKSNTDHRAVISTGPVTVRVIATNEETMIASIVLSLSGKR